MSGVTLKHGTEPAGSSQYVWIINSVSNEIDATTEVATTGPKRGRLKAPVGMVIQEGERFCLLDLHDRTLYSGYIYGDYTGREPLADFGWKNGCTKIQYANETSQEQGV